MEEEKKGEIMKKESEGRAGGGREGRRKGREEEKEEGERGEREVGKKISTRDRME